MIFIVSITTYVVFSLSSRKEVCVTGLLRDNTFSSYRNLRYLATLHVAGEPLVFQFAVLLDTTLILYCNLQYLVTLQVAGDPFAL